VELLEAARFTLPAIGVEEVPALVREDDRLVMFAQRDGPNQTFVAQVVKRVVVTGIVPLMSEVTLGDDSERADGRQGTAVFAIQFVDVLAVDHQLARVAARQVQVVHQAVARIVLAVALVIDARTPIITFAPVIPSGIVHSPSCVMHRFECA
jgi:hypothetical protein